MPPIASSLIPRGSSREGGLERKPSPALHNNRSIPPLAPPLTAVTAPSVRPVLARRASNYAHVPLVPPVVESHEYAASACSA